MSKRKRIVQIVILVVTLFVVLVAAQLVLAGGPRARRGAEIAAVETRTYSIQTDTAQSGTIRSLIRLNGEVVPTNSVDAFPDVAGEVQSLFVEVGDRVRRGQTVALVDPSRPGARFEASPLTAPIQGTVTAVYVERGGTVLTSTPVLAVGQLDTLEVVVDIPERFIGAVREDMTAEVQLSAFPESTFTVPATEISPLLDSTTRTKEIRFLLDPDETRAEAGMFAEIAIETERRDDVVLVPVESIVTRSGEDYVFVVADESRAELRDIEVGLIENQMAEISDGLSPGEPIVVRGQNVIEDGSAVRVLSDADLAVSEGGEG